MMLPLFDVLMGFSVGLLAVALMLGLTIGGLGTRLGARRYERWLSIQSADLDIASEPAKRSAPSCTSFSIPLGSSPYQGDGHTEEPFEMRRCLLEGKCKTPTVSSPLGSTPE